MAKFDAIDYPVAKIQEWISAGWTQAKIAEHLQESLDSRVTAKSVYKVCRKHGIKCQRTGPRAAEGHPNWMGGRISNKDGYVEIYTPEHPNARKHTKYILEHRLVMEEHLGRFLLPLEVVHHKNGDKQDNRIENLEVFSTNSKHLAKTLVGQIPKWTDDGKRRISEGNKLKDWVMGTEQRERHRVRLKTLHAIQSALKLRASPNKQTIDHYLGGLGISFAEACEMVSTLGSLPPLSRPMRAHGSLP